MSDYRVQLDAYSGPMDLLLYLIRRDEVDVYDIPISRILEQYLGYVKLLEQVDPEVVGEFLVLAATLMEIKSRMLLPKPPPEQLGDDTLDPRADLVRQLLAYRTYREAALRLADKAELHSQRFARPGQEVPGDESVDLEDVQIWDLLTAFNKLLAAVGRSKATHDVRYDDTPVALHAADVLDRLEREGPTMPFERIFEGRSRSEMVGLFLALLELIRQHRVRIQQELAFGAIVVTLVDATPITSVLEARSDEEIAAENEAALEFEDEPAEPEPEIEIEDAPFEEVEPHSHSEAVFEEEDEDEDEFSRRINAVEIADVDLGRSLRTAEPARNSERHSPATSGPERTDEPAELPEDPQAEEPGSPGENT
jgi:segregation and condensation protein A